MIRILNIIINRIIFSIKFKTLKKVLVVGDKYLYLSSSRGNFKINRRCPHQGAYLEKAYINDNIVTCHWHGCKIYINAIGKKYEILFI
tara:strand:- start:125 stop:388 length:264 start_codon:yes stop_codon:yes gene_type:complete